MRRVRFSTLALADVKEIAEYIGRDSHAAALRVINRIEEICFSLGEFPELGVTSEVRGARKLIVPEMPYKVIYQHIPTKRLVVILRVYHDARNVNH